MLSPFLLHVLCATGSCGDEGRRASVWNEIVAINDRSVRTVQTRENVTIEDGSPEPFHFYDYELREDEQKNSLVQGWHRARSRTTGETSQSPDLFRMRDGVMFSSSHDGELGVIRPERPDLLIYRCAPSILTGLGRSISPMELLTLSETIRRCGDLRVESETGGIVRLTGVGILSPLRDGRAFRVQVDLHDKTGDVQRIAIYDTRWETLFVRWEMDEWKSFGSARVPLSTTYSVFEWKISTDERAKLSEGMKAAGLDGASVSPLNPRYREWTELRDEVLGGPLDVRLTTPMQRARTTVLGINQPATPNWLNLPETLAPRRFLSAYLDCPVDQFRCEPSDGYVGPPGPSDGEGSR